MKTNFFYSDAFSQIIMVAGIVLVTVLSGILGYWFALEGGANLTETNPFNNAVLFANSLLFFVPLLVAFIFAFCKFTNWQIEQQFKN